MMLRYLPWTEAADLVINAVDAAIRKKTVTADFAYIFRLTVKIKVEMFCRGAELQM